jgi:hypothetical protein
VRCAVDPLGVRVRVQAWNYKQSGDRIPSNAHNVYHRHRFTSRPGLPANAYQLPPRNQNNNAHQTSAGNGNNGNSGSGSTQQMSGSGNTTTTQSSGSGNTTTTQSSGSIEGPQPYVSNGQSTSGGANNGNYVIPGFNAPTATAPTTGSGHKK